MFALIESVEADLDPWDVVDAASEVYRFDEARRTLQGDDPEHFGRFRRVDDEAA